MRNFAKWQKSAILIEMQLNRLVMHFNKALEIMRGTKAGQRDGISSTTDFKGFFIRDERDTTASAGSGTQPPHPPKGGWGLCPARAVTVFIHIRRLCSARRNNTLPMRTFGKNGAECNRECFS